MLCDVLSSCGEWKTIRRHCVVIFRCFVLVLFEASFSWGSAFDAVKKRSQKPGGMFFWCYDVLTAIVKFDLLFDQFLYKSLYLIHIIPLTVKLNCYLSSGLDQPLCFIFKYIFCTWLFSFGLVIANMDWNSSIFLGWLGWFNLMDCILLFQVQPLLLFFLIIFITENKI